MKQGGIIEGKEQIIFHLMLILTRRNLSMIVIVTVTCISQIIPHVLLVCAVLPLVVESRGHGSQLGSFPSSILNVSMGHGTHVSADK